MSGKDRYIADVKKHAGEVNEAAVAGIVRHLGIALRSRDSSFVAASDPEELKRVRESWLKKKLGLPGSDSELDAAIKAVADKMKSDRMKERVTFYYLLAQHFNKLDTLATPAASASKAAVSQSAGKAEPSKSKKSA